MKVISRFVGAHSVFSNFYPAVVHLDGMEYPTVEHAYQAAKTKDPEARFHILAQRLPGGAKTVGKHVPRRPDWDSVKIEIMRSLLREKFFLNPQCGQVLLATGDAKLIEGNAWGDKFWGAVWCPPVGEDEHGHWDGENHLGRLLVGIRAELKEIRDWVAP